MRTFNDLWLLLSPKVEYANRRRACYELWNSLPENRQDDLYDVISDKLSKGLFVDYNPLFAMKNNSSLPFGRGGVGFPQILSFRDYYAKFGTTEECNGWQRQFLPEKQTTIYVKG